MWVRVACRVAYREEQRTVATSFREKSMIICDLCGEAKNCLQKQIEGKEYDICSECWNPFAQKLRGKGRMKNRSRCPENRRRFGAQWRGHINKPCNEPVRTTIETSRFILRPFESDDVE